MKILAISGSLREGSLNTCLLRTAKEFAKDSTIEIYDYSDVPLFNEDPETPASVTAFRDALREADGLLISTPEYNHSIPGVLKNILDWASRPRGNAAAVGKPVAVMAASMGALGGVRAQEHMKLVSLGMGMKFFTGPDVLVGSAHTKVEGGVVVDQGTRDFMQKFVLGFEAFIAK